MVAFSLLALIAILPCLITIHAAVLSLDSRYQNWLKLFPSDPYVRVPVFVDKTRYSNDAVCLQNINAAIQAMNTDLNGCVQFLPLTSAANVGRDFLWISTTFNNNSVSPTCASVPGRIYNQNQQGQKTMIVGSSSAAGCCSTTRDVMRYLANTLGLRNEYQRADRPFTATNTASIHSSLTAFGMYDTYPADAPVQIFTSNPAFDANSIMMVPKNRYSKDTTNVWDFDSAQTTTTTVGTLPRLSLIDCQAIAQKYGCTGTCADPYNG